MSVPSDFALQLAERTAGVRATKQAEQETIKKAAKDEQTRLADIAAKEEAWFPTAQKWRDDELVEMLEQARSALQDGVVMREDRNRSFWAFLKAEKRFEIGVAIIPAAFRNIVLLRATASVHKRGIPNQVYDKSADLSPDQFDPDAMNWFSEQIVEMTAVVLGQLE